mgnify:CR=1 FL=1
MVKKEKYILLDKYIDFLLENSDASSPMWNIERIRSGCKNKWNYIDACMISAYLELYEIKKDKKYLNFCDKFVFAFVNEDGSINTYDIKEYNIDNIRPGKNLFKLFELTGKEKYRKAMDTVYSQLKSTPRTEEGNFWHKKIYPYQVWLDGLYMAQPFYMEYETKYNRMRFCIDSFSQFENVERIMKDTNTGLYYHGYDESRQSIWCDAKTGLSKNFWLRSIGWFILSLLDTALSIDESLYYEYRRLKDMLNDLADSLLKYQDKSGMFYQLVNRQNDKGNYPETSGSALISYTFLKGSRTGLLPGKFKNYGRQIFDGILDKYLRREGGEISLGGICLVAGLGGSENRDGSEAYYYSEPIVKNDAKGVAPLFMAYTEIARLECKDDRI